MKRDFYVVFSSIEEAQAFSDAIVAAMPHMGPEWDKPRLHPTEDHVLIAWNEQHLAPLTYLRENRPILSELEAVAEGWIFHPYFRGTFAAARAKLEDAQLIADAMWQAASAGNFAAVRALFVGFLGSLYAIKESIKEICESLGDPSASWWAARFMDIRADPLMCAIYDLNNHLKHQPRIPAMVQSVRFYGFSTPEEPTDLIISRDGVYRIIGRGTARERRIPVSGADLQVQLVIHDQDGQPLGEAMAVVARVLNFYEDLVFGARSRFERDPWERRALSHSLFTPG
jgi:hypothetical protein